MSSKKSYSELGADTESQSLLNADAHGGAERCSYDQGRKRCCRRRCRRAHLRALSFFIIVYSLFRFVLPEIHTGFKRLQDDRTIPVPDDIMLGRCANWTSSERKVEFYVDMKAPLFVAQGTLAAGEFEVIQVKGAADPDKAKVTVSASFQDAKFLDYVQVCEIRSTERSAESGVGIFSVPWRPRPNGRFHVMVELPVVNEASLKRLIPSFRTRMPSFVQRFHDLSDIRFDDLQLKSMNSPIIAWSLEAREAYVTTTDAPILGNFTVQDVVSLITSNANINVGLELQSDLALKQMKRSSALLSTSNAPIRATSSLTKVGWEKYVSRFDIKAETSRADIDIDFDRVVVDNELILDASTSFGRAQVTVPPEYDGPWTMEAPFPFRKEVDTRGWGVPEDPAGRGRTRVSWSYDSGAFVEHGAIIWDHGENSMGNIRLKSVLGSTRIIV